MSNDNVTLRGMSLRNTDEVIGVIIYTGSETKIQMNTQNAGYKISNLQHQTNHMIVLVVIAIVVVAFVVAYVGAKWQTENIYSASYLGMDTTDKWASQFGYLLLGLTGTWILIFT